MKNLRQQTDLLRRHRFSKPQLVLFLIVFGAIGYLIFKGFASTNTKVWDTQADFQSGTLSNTTATADGHVTLTPTTTGGGTGANVSLPTHEIHVEPYNYDPTGSVSAGQGFYWNSYSSPSTARWVTSGNYRTLRVNGQGNSYMGATSDYQDDWWIDWQDYFPSSFNDPASAGYMKNFHNTPGDIGWDAASGVSGVSSVAFRFDPGTNWYQLDLLDGYSADQHDFNLYQPTRNTWHSVLVHIIFGRAENGVTPKKGRVQVWVDGNNTPVLDTNNSFPNGISTIAKPGYGTYANQLQQKVTLFEGGPYNLHFQGSAPAIHDTTAMQFGTTLSGALSDTPSEVSGWGGVQIPGSPTVEAGHPDSYELTVASRNANQFQVPSSLGGSGSTTTYPSSGTITLPFDCGTTCSWDNITPVQTTPSGTSISYQYRSSTDNVNWSAYTSALSSVPQGRYFQVKATLSTTSSTTTPDIDKITLGYTPLTSNTKVWDTQADFNGGTLSSATATSDGHLTLTPTSSGGGSGSANIQAYTLHLYGQNTEQGPSVDTHSGDWVYGDSPTTETTDPNGSGDKHRIIWWAPGHHYANRVSWILWQFKPKQLASQENGPGRMLNFHDTPALPGGWDWGGGVSPVAFDFYNSVQTDDKSGAQFEGLSVVAEPTGDCIENLCGHTYHWTVVPLSQWDAAVRSNSWISLVAKITWGNVNDPINSTRGAIETWVNGSDTPSLNVSGINTFYFNAFSKESPSDTFTNPGTGQQGITLWTGGYVTPSSGFGANEEVGTYDFAVPRVGATLAEAMQDGVSWPINSWPGAVSTNYGGGPGTYIANNGTVGSNAMLIPPSLGGGGATTYPSSGTATLPFDCGTTCSWDNITPVQTTPSGTSISYQYRSSTDNVNWSAYTSALSSVPQGRYFQVKATLSTTNSTVTPDIDKISLSYTPQSGGGGGTGAVTISQSVSNNQTIKGTFTWTATTSNDSQVQSVSFYVDNNLRNTETSAPWGSGDAPNTDAGQVNSTQYADGTHVLKAVATLTDNSTVSTSASVTIQNASTSPPVFVSSSVTNGQTLSGTVSWTVNTSGSVASVEYWMDGSKLSTDSASPYVYSWDTTKVANGSHLINAVLVGADGSRVSAGSGGILGGVTINNTAGKIGDLDGNGKVDSADLAIMIVNYNTSFSGADLNGDGKVDGADFSKLLTNYGQ